MIGVHVRIHDQLYDWEVVPPAPGDEKKTATAFGEATKLEDFRTQMVSIEERLKARESTLTNIKPSHRFFILSNNLDTKQALVA
jgi:hypothetical protein